MMMMSSHSSNTAISPLCQKKMDLYAAVPARKETTPKKSKATQQNKVRNSRYVCAAESRLQVSLPIKMLRLPHESAEQQFARITSPQQTEGIVHACGDYYQLMGNNKLEFWAEKILGMGAAGTPERAAALAKDSEEDLAMLAERRRVMLKQMHDIMVNAQKAVARRN